MIFIVFCLLLVFSSQLAFAETKKYYNIDIESCDKITVSYYNGGEFPHPLMPGYYNYVTTDSAEMEDILAGSKVNKFRKNNKSMKGVNEDLFEENVDVKLNKTQTRNIGL